MSQPIKVEVLRDWNELPDDQWQQFAWRWIWFAKQIDVDRLVRVDLASLDRDPMIGPQQMAVGLELQNGVHNALRQLQEAIAKLESEQTRIREAG